MLRGPAIPLFRLLGFQVSAHWTLPLALILAGVSRGGLSGVLLSALLFVSILLHELGHAVISRRRGVQITGIDLHFFGGTANMASPPRSPNDEIAIALAGPAVSLLLAGAGLVANALVPSPLLLWVGAANLMLGLFNLLPALPMDGGRVLRALLARRRGLVGGTALAVRVSRVVAVGIGLLGLWSNPWLIVMAALVWSMGSAELRGVLRHDALARMGAWHPAHVPWMAYDQAAAQAARKAGPRRDRATVIAPEILPPEDPRRRRWAG